MPNFVSLISFRWVYAIRAVSSEISAKNEKWTWAYIQQRSTDRQAYIELYKKKRQDKMSNDDKKSLENLERKLSYEDLLLYRKLANAAFNREKKKADEERAKGGFLSWFGVKKADKETPEESAEDVMKELYTKIGYTPENAPK